MRISTLRAMAHGAIALVLAACGGGGDGGIGGTGTTPQDVSVGTITAFGSVWVNGVEFKSNTATIKIDDNPHPESDLRIGMVARVKGSISGAQADEIRVNSAAKGWVESVNGNAMVVMGQNVIADPGAVSNGPIAAGNFVEVHGTVAPDGTVLASFIEKKTPPVPLAFAVKGFVKSHNTTTNAFAVGSLNVVIGASPTLNDMPSGSWNGILVEVKGTACVGNPPASNICGTLTATKVEPDTPRGDNAKVEFEGIAANVAISGATATFNVGSQAVTTNGSTIFVGGLLADLVSGTKVEVEGSISGNVLTATKVSFRENIRFEANISTKGATSFTLVGLPGITIETNLLTKFSGNNVTNFGGLAANQNVRVRGRPASGGTVVATEVEVRNANPNTDVRFQAIATSAVDPNLTMLGLTIDTTSASGFQDISSATLTRAQFFATAAGKLVKVRGTLNLGSGVIAWNREVELED